MYSSLEQSIGNTPLLRIKNMEEASCELYVKLENKNPAGSIKDRIALYLLDKALEEGQLLPGGTVVEPTSGNTGIALAMIAPLRHVHCVLTMPENMSLERQKLMRAYGAELILTPAAQGMAGALEAAERIAAQRKAFVPNQFANDHVVQAHYTSTGPEIYTAFTKENLILDALVAGMGTGGTVSGTGLYLKEKIPHIKVYGVEPAESALISTGKSGPHGIQGIGANFVPPILRQDVLDDIRTVRTEDALATAKALFQKEGLCCGISSGANVFAALQLAKQGCLAGKRIVTFICDTGERYLSTKLFEK